MFDVLHTVINSVYVQTLPTEQATSVVTDFFSRGHCPFAHACKARPPPTVGRTSLSVSLSFWRPLAAHGATLEFSVCFQHSHVPRPRKDPQLLTSAPLICDRPARCVQVSAHRSLQVQDSVDTEKPELVLVSSLVESFPVSDGARRFCVSRRKVKNVSFCTEILLAPLWHKTRENPRAEVATGLTSITT